MDKNTKGKSTSPGRIHILSGISSLVCIVMMFVPAAEDSLAFNDYHYWGEMLNVCSRAVSGFYESELIWKVLALLMIVVVILLLFWAMRSFKKPESIGKIGVVASIANLVVSAFMALIMSTGAIPRVLTIVPVITVIVAIIALVLALKQKRVIR